MWKLSLAALVFAAMSTAAFAADLGKVIKVLRPTVRVFDAEGQPAGTLNAGDLKTPAQIVGVGKGQSIGVKVAGKVIYLRGLDVQTEGFRASCQPVESSARTAGTSYAGTNMGMGGAADCAKH
jgi:hypothetical protein